MFVKKVLIVDDAEVILRLEMAFLARACFDIHSARSGKEALRKAREVRPDLILLDLHLPDIDGDAVCRQLKGDPETRGINIIMITTDGIKESRERCRASNCDGFLTKPFTQESLSRVVEETLGIMMRANPRVETGTRCVVTWEGGRGDGVLGNISEGGAFVCTETLVPTDCPLELSFMLPENRGPYVSTVSVRWSGRMGPDGPRGFGVCFGEMESVSKIEIRSYLRRRLREQAENWAVKDQGEPLTTGVIEA